MKHNYRLDGPDITGPFTVVKGLVAVNGEIRIALPPGAAWLGLDQLPDWLAEKILPQDADIVAGTVILQRPLTPSEINAGIALIHAQLLQGAQLGLTERLGLIGRVVPLRTVNQGTLAALVGTNRTTITKHLADFPHPS